MLYRVGHGRRVTIYKTLGVRQKHLEEVFDVPFLHKSIHRLQAHFQVLLRPHFADAAVTEHTADTCVISSSVAPVSPNNTTDLPAISSMCQA